MTVPTSVLLVVALAAAALIFATTTYLAADLSAVPFPS